MTSALPIPSISVEALIAARDRMLDVLSRFDRELAEASTALGRFDVFPPRTTVYFVSSEFERHLGDTRDARRTVGLLAEDIDRAVWDALFRLSNVGDLMDRKTREDFERSLRTRYANGERTKVPPLTPESIESTIQGLAARASEFFSKAVEHVFRRLSWDYKTNAPYRMGERMIVSSAISWHSTPSAGKWDRIACDALEDLERCLCIVDGAPLPTHETGVRSLREIEIGKWFEVPPTGGRLLLRAKLYKNRNAHVQLVERETVDALNRIVAGMHPFAIGEARSA